MSAELTLYHYWRSSSSWRVRWALELKGVKTKLIPVDLVNGESESEAHLARNPLGYVPVLYVGNKTMIESVAILEWLDETYPSPKIYSGDAFQRQQIRTLVEIINADTQPIQNPNVVERAVAEPQKRKEWNQHFITRGLTAYETIVSKSVGKFSVGDQITAADLCLIPQCYNALRFEVDLSQFPLISKIHAAAMQTAEAKRTEPSQYQPE